MGEKRAQFCGHDIGRHNDEDNRLKAVVTFQLMDDDKSGRLSRKEIIRYLKDEANEAVTKMLFGHDFKMTDHQPFFAALDVDHSGDVDEQEWIDFYTECCRRGSEFWPHHAGAHRPRSAMDIN